MKKIFFLMLFPLILKGQNIYDAVDWSTDDEYGNARYSSMSGAFGATGGNLSAISINPASGSVFDLSRFGGTIQIYNQSINSSFNGSVNKTKQNFNNFQFGLVYVLKNYGKSNLKKLAFGINHQTQNSFNSNINTIGRSQKSVDSFFLNNATESSIDNLNVSNNESISSVYRWLGENYGYPDQQAFLAYQSYLINYDEDSGSFYSNTIINSEINIENFLFSTGNNSLTSLNFSGQFKNLFWGINININEINNNKEFIHQEKNFDSQSPITSVDFRNYLNSNGYGISAQLGLIYLLNKLRLGFSYNTPTYYNFTDELEQYIKTESIDLNGNQYEDILAPSIINIYDYNFKSPSRIIFSLASILKNKFLVNIDLMLKNYNGAKFENTFYETYSTLNSQIKNNLKSTLDFKLGGEYKINNVSLRAGYKRVENPFKNFDKKFLSSVSFGFGFDFDNSTIDFSFSVTEKNYNYQMFDSGLTDLSKINDRQKRFGLTYNIIF